MPKRIVDLRTERPCLDIVSFGRRGPETKLTPGEVASIARTASRVPEVMIKVSGGARTLRGVDAHFDYIGREGLGQIETEHRSIRLSDEIRTHARPSNRRASDADDRRASNDLNPRSRSASLVVAAKRNVGEHVVCPLPSLRFEIPEASRILRMSRAQLYHRISEGAIKIQKDGARTYITTGELERYVKYCDAWEVTPNQQTACSSNLRVLVPPTATSSTTSLCHTMDMFDSSQAVSRVPGSHD